MSEHSRSYTWDDPFALRDTMAGRSGLELMQMMAAGDLPPPPIAKTLGFRLVEASRWSRLRRHDLPLETANESLEPLQQILARAGELRFRVIAQARRATSESMATLRARLPFGVPILPRS